MEKTHMAFEIYEMIHCLNECALLKRARRIQRRKWEKEAAMNYLLFSHSSPMLLLIRIKICNYNFRSLLWLTHNSIVEGQLDLSRRKKNSIRIESN